MNIRRIYMLVLVIIFVAAAAAGTHYLWSKNKVVETNTIQTNKTLLNRPEQTIINQVSNSRAGWMTMIDQKLGFSFEYPNDAKVSSVVQRQTTDGVSISELIVTPAGGDPTRVHFFTTNVSLDKAKNIQIYESSNIKNSEFNNTVIDGYTAVRRIDHYLYNDCNNQLTVVQKGMTIYGSHIVQCSSHPQGYDQLRRDIVNSFKIL